MFKSQKHVFWEALLIAIFIFALGIFLGYIIELNRTSKIIEVYQQSELDLLDIKIQDSIMSSGIFDCNSFTKETMNFADRVYDEAKTLERYESSSKLSQGIMLQHKKYDLLRTLLWLNSIELKERCGDKFTTIVYIYEYNVLDTNIRAEQAAFSRKLSQIKEQYGSDVLLIPIAGNLEVNSLNILKQKYNITIIPSVLINENIKIEDIEGLKSIDSYISKNSTGTEDNIVRL